MYELFLSFIFLLNDVPIYEYIFFIYSTLMSRVPILKLRVFIPLTIFEFNNIGVNSLDNLNLIKPHSFLKKI